MKSKLFTLVAISMLLANSVRAQVPRTISYQGTIATNGAQANGPHLITVALYDALIGGTSLYQEQHHVTVSNGIFDMSIGSDTPIPASLIFDRPYYLAITIDGGAELAPRTLFTSVPYALHTSLADLAEGLTPDAHGVVTSINELAGALHFNGDSTLAITENGNTISMHSNVLGVRSLNGQTGAITLVAGTGTALTSGAGTITISSVGGAGGTGIQGVSNSDGTIAITNPGGPIAKVGIAGVTTATNGQVLTANGGGGASWKANNSLTFISADAPLSGLGSAASHLKFADGTTAGQVLTWNGFAWVAASIGVGNGPGWSTTGNSGTTFGTNFLGTTDNVSLQFRANNVQSGLIQVGGGIGSGTTGFGYGVLSNNTSGTWNTAFGYQALYSNTTAYYNTANGYQALFSNTAGQFNTAVGTQALNSNTTGGGNTAVGSFVLHGNTTGNENTGIGERALSNNTTGNGNTAIGGWSYFNATTGNYNTAIGSGAQNGNSTGSCNTSCGYASLYNNYSYYNTAVGDSALLTNQVGYDNTAIGHLADISSNTILIANATAIGANAIVGQSNAVVLGNNADVGIGTSTPRAKLDVVSTGAVIVAVGTTSQRPSSPVQGMIRYNTTTSHFEGYDGSAWNNLD